MARFNQVTGKYEDDPNSFAAIARRAREAEAAKLTAPETADVARAYTGVGVERPAAPGTFGTLDERIRFQTAAAAQAGQVLPPVAPRPELTTTPPAVVEEAPRPMDLRAAFEQAAKSATPRAMDLVAPATTPLPTAGKTFRDYVPQGSGMVETMAGFGQMRREQGMQDAGTLMSIRKDLTSQLEQEKLAGETAQFNDRLAGEVGLARVKGAAEGEFKGREFGLKLISEQTAPLRSELDSINKQLASDVPLPPERVTALQARKALLTDKYNRLFSALQK